jgi:hypothetical protein
MSGTNAGIPVYRSESTTSGAADLSTIRPREIYVIIGRGFAAMANHLTLRASQNPEVRARVDRCRFVIIGGEEPWQPRGATPLGQFPHMLRLPTHEPLGGGKAYASSDRFGGYIRDAEASLNRYCDHNVKLGLLSWVGLIEAYANRGSIPEDERKRRKDPAIAASGPQEDDWDLHPGFPYRLSVYWRNKPTESLNRSYLYAHYVDICTGPGPVRLMPSEVWNPPILGDELEGTPYDPPDYLRDKPGEFKRLIKGEHHIGANLPTEPEKKRILIYGASPSSAWSAEHVLKKGNAAALCWVADPKYAPPEAKGKPYLEALRINFYHPTKANAPGGRNLETLDATCHQHYLGTITRIEEGGGGTLKVTFSVQEDAPDEWKKTTVHAFDQVVISIGQDNDKKRPGSAAYLVQELGDLTPIYAKDLWDGLSGTDGEIPLGIQSDRGAIRILGSAAVSAPGLARGPADKFREDYKAFSAALPHEGRAGGNSLLVASATTEMANRHMPSLLDINRTCSSLIERLLGSADDAKKIIEARKNDSMRSSENGVVPSYQGKGFLTMDEIVSFTQNAGSRDRFIDLI